MLQFTHCEHVLIISRIGNLSILYFSFSEVFLLFFLFLYKDHLVVTDESLYLTEWGDGSPEAPWGFPRFECETWEELDAWLEETYYCLEEDGLI